MNTLRNGNPWHALFALLLVLPSWGRTVEIECGNTETTGQITAVGEVDVYEWTLEAGDQGWIRFIGVEGFHAKIQVFDAADNALFLRQASITGGYYIDGSNREIDGTSGAFIFTTVESGIFRILIEADNRRSTGGYRFVAQVGNRPCDALDVEDCGRIDLALESRLSTAPFRFNSGKGGTFRVGVSPAEESAPSFQPVVWVFDGSGARPEITRPGESLDFETGPGEDVSLFVTDRRGSEVGEFSLQWAPIAAPCDSVNLECGDSVEAAIGQIGETDYYGINLAAGDHTWIRYRSTAGFEVELQVFDPEGNVLALTEGNISSDRYTDGDRTRSGGASGYASFDAGAPGIYRIVFESLRASRTGDYEFNIQTVNIACEGVAVERCGAIEGVLESELAPAVFRMNAASGDTVRIAVTPTDGSSSSFRPMTWVYDTSGKRIGVTRDGRPGRFSTTAGEDLVVYVVDESGSHTDSYSLTWTSLGNPCDATPIRCGETVEGVVVGAEDFKIYQLALTENDQAWVRFFSESGTSAHVSVFDQGGVEITAGTGRRDLFFDADRAGVYNVVIETDRSAPVQFGRYQFTAQVANRPCAPLDITKCDSIEGALSSPTSIQTFNLFLSEGEVSSIGVDLLEAIDGNPEPKILIYDEAIDGGLKIVGSESVFSGLESFPIMADKDGPVPFFVINDSFSGSGRFGVSGSKNIQCECRPKEAGNSHLAISSPEENSTTNEATVNVSGLLTFGEATAVDLFLLVDRSVSVEENDERNDRLGALAKLVEGFPDGSSVNLGVIGFAGQAESLMELGESTGQFDQVLEELKEFQQYTNLEAGLTLASEKFESAGRAEALKQVIMFSDGESNIGGDPIFAARRLYELGAEVHAVYFGPAGGPGETQMRLISEASCGSFLAIEPNSPNLLDVFSILPFAPTVDSLQLTTSADPGFRTEAEVVGQFWNAATIPIVAAPGATTVITAKATIAGEPNVSLEDSVQVIFQGKDFPIEVAIIEPAPESRFLEDKRIGLLARAEDLNDGIAFVDFVLLDSEEVLGRSGSFPYRFEIGPLSVGPYTVVARATNNALEVKDSEPLTFHVDADVDPRLIPPEFLEFLEGNQSASSKSLQVRLDPPTSERVTVDYSIASNGNIELSGEYPDIRLTESGSLVFEPGQTEATIDFLIQGDDIFEEDELFVIGFSNPTNANLERGTTTVTILNDDSVPAVFVNATSGAESLDLETSALFALTLDRQSESAVQIGYSTLSGSAIKSEDYVDDSGVLEIAPYEQETGVSFKIKDDNIAEGDETFLLQLSDEGSLISLPDVPIHGVIRDDDETIVSFDDLSRSEGDEGWSEWEIPLTLSNSNSRNIVVSYSTRSLVGEATEGEDYQKSEGVLELLPEATSGSVKVSVFGDLEVERDENFEVEFSISENARLMRSSLRVTIKNDDPVGNRRPNAAIANPERFDVFDRGDSGASIDITCDAWDVDGEVVSVEFIANGQSIGEVFDAPYEITWQDVGIGPYNLICIATDDNGLTGASQPVEILVASGVDLVAIVRDRPDQESFTMRKYLYELGLGSVVFEQEGLTFERIQEAERFRNRQFKLLIWNDQGLPGNKIGETRPALLASTVNVIDKFFQTRPVYLIGRNLGAALEGNATSWSEPVRERWQTLSGVREGVPVKGSVEFQSVVPGAMHDILNARFGTPETFEVRDPTYPLLGEPGDKNTLASIGSVPVFGSVPGVFQGDRGEIRRASQSFLVRGDETSVDSRKPIFQNTVCWLLRCHSCDSYSLGTFELRSDVSRNLRVGERFVLEILVERGGSECAITGAEIQTRLTDGLRFMRANPAVGSYQYDPENNVVTFFTPFLNSEPDFENLYSIDVEAVQVGDFEIVADFSARFSEARSGNTSAVFRFGVEGAPKIAIISASENELVIRVEGNAHSEYALDHSNDLQRWRSLPAGERILGPVWQGAVLLETFAETRSPTFLRARMIE